MPAIFNLLGVLGFPHTRRGETERHQAAPPGAMVRMTEKMRFFFYSLALLGATASLAEAGPFSRRGRSCSASGSCATTTVTTTQAQPAKPAPQPAAQGNTSTAQGVAILISSTGRFRHWGGNHGPEGIGLGATPEQALRNCCYFGRYQIADVGYAQMANGSWVAVARYR